MFQFLKNSISNLSNKDTKPTSGSLSSGYDESGTSTPESRAICTKFPYGRPSFLEMTDEDEQREALNHSQRKICVPKRTDLLPRSAGYAECTNAGKSPLNEDQAVAIRLKLGSVTQSHLSEFDSSCNTQSYIETDPSSINLTDLIIYGIFDGHAGPDVAVTVSHELPFRILNRLDDVLDDIRRVVYGVDQPEPPSASIRTKKKLSLDDLVVGALQSAFHDMDENLVTDRSSFIVKGGCTCVIALMYAGKLYIANAGDSRAVMKHQKTAIPMSRDFTPESERKRLQYIGEEHPDLLGDEFSSRQFSQRITRKDLGSQMFYRDSQMDGWANKIVTEEDMRFPMIIGEGRRARLLATIGVTRGFGDHDLRVFDSNIKIKPFLSCTPEIKVFDISKHELSEDDVIIMATDGLWDVVSNQQAVHIVANTMKKLSYDYPARYMAAAVELINKARGKQDQQRRSDIWMMEDQRGNYASHDDISCLVIPLVYKFYQHPEPAPQVVVGTPSIEKALEAAQVKRKMSDGDNEFADGHTGEHDVTPTNNDDDEAVQAEPVSAQPEHEGVQITQEIVGQGDSPANKTVSHDECDSENQSGETKKISSENGATDAISFETTGDDALEHHSDTSNEHHEDTEPNEISKLTVAVTIESESVENNTKELLTNDGKTADSQDQIPSIVVDGPDSSNF